MPGQHGRRGWFRRGWFRHGWVGAASAVVLAASAAGCATGDGGAGGDGNGDLQAETCLDWVLFDSPADALADATAALRTTGPTSAAGTTQLFGAEANLHTVQVDAVLKGTDLQVGQDVEVAATPVTCTAGGTYPDGDPLDASGSLIVLLSWDDDAQVWRTMTPNQGVMAATADGTLPPTWPTP